VAIEFHARELRCEILILKDGEGDGEKEFSEVISWSWCHSRPVSKHGVSSGGNPDHVPAKAVNYIKTGFLLPQE
jgi:hypothetical protein